MTDIIMDWAIVIVYVTKDFHNVIIRQNLMLFIWRLQHFW